MSRPEYKVGDEFQHKVYPHIHYKLLKINERRWYGRYILEVIKHTKKEQIGVIKDFTGKSMGILELTNKLKDRKNSELLFLLKK